MSNKLGAFKGFTKQTIQFLKDLGENNYKEWFEEHREVYETELLKPFKELVLALTPAMYNIDSSFEFRPHRVLSRIYRDTRFSKNKDPYKDHMWMTFERPYKDWENYPGFFMELGTNRYMLGMGLFAPKKSIMDSLRNSIAYDANEFQEKTQLILDRGYSIGGEEYKRPLKNDLPNYFQQWIQRKSLYVYKEMALGKEVFSPDFAKVIQDEYEALAWLYDFLRDE